MWSPLEIACKEMLHLARDRMSLAMFVRLSIVQLTVFGFAVDSDVRDASTVVYELDLRGDSRVFARSLEATGFYDLVGNVSSYDEIERAMRQGKARVALVFPPDYGANLVRGVPARLQLVVDGSDPQTVASATNTAASLAIARSSQLLVGRMQTSGIGGFQPIELESSIWYNPELKTAVYVVAGLVGVILTMTMVMFTAMGIARERERGTLEQLIVSPVRPIELVLGKIVPYIGIGYVQMTLILLIGTFGFGVPIHGSLLLLYALSFVFIAANLAVGLMFSTVAQTQQQAMQMSFFFLLPNILLSGFMFPFEAMPKPAQALAELLPLTHFLRIVRAITLRGSGFEDVQAELVWLSGILGALIVFTSLRFRKKLI
jgi:ABC-2 type transport system permease protein